MTSEDVQAAAPGEPATVEQYPAGSGTVALLVVTAVVVLSQLYAAIPLLPAVSKALHRDATLALSTVFSVCYAVGFLVWGPLADHVGRKRIKMIGLALLVGATVACGLAGSWGALEVSRAAQGLVASSFAPVALAYLTEATPPARRATAIGAMSTAFLVAGIVGQVAAATLVLRTSWHVFFLASAGALVLCLAALTIFVTEPAREASHESLTGRYLAVAKVAVHPKVLLLAGAHITLLLSFVAMYTSLGPHLVTLGMAPKQVIWLRLVALPGMFAALLAGPLGRRLTNPGLARAGFVIAAAGLAGEAFLSGSLVGVAAASIVFVTGVALAVPAMITLFGQAAAPNRAGGMALNGFVLFLGASLGPLVARWHLGFQTLLGGLAGIMLLAAVLVTASNHMASTDGPSTDSRPQPRRADGHQA